MEEIDFLAKWGEFTPTEEESEEYIKATVFGGKVLGTAFNNRLFQARRRFHISLKAWQEDMSLGILKINELLSDEKLKHPYLNKVLKGMS